MSQIDLNLIEERMRENILAQLAEHSPKDVEKIFPGVKINTSGPTPIVSIRQDSGELKHYKIVHTENDVGKTVSTGFTGVAAIETNAGGVPVPADKPHVLYAFRGLNQDVREDILATLALMNGKPNHQLNNIGGFIDETAKALTRSNIPIENTTASVTGHSMAATVAASVAKELKGRYPEAIKNKDQLVVMEPVGLGSVDSPPPGIEIDVLVDTAQGLKQTGARAAQDGKFKNGPVFEDRYAVIIDKKNSTPVDSMMGFMDAHTLSTMSHNIEGEKNIIPYPEIQFRPNNYYNTGKVALQSKLQSMLANGKKPAELGASEEGFPDLNSMFSNLEGGGIVALLMCLCMMFLGKVPGGKESAGKLVDNSIPGEWKNKKLVDLLAPNGPMEQLISKLPADKKPYANELVGQIKDFADKNRGATLEDAIKMAQISDADLDRISGLIAAGSRKNNTFVALKSVSRTTSL